MILCTSTRQVFILGFDFSAIDKLDLKTCLKFIKKTPDLDTRKLELSILLYILQEQGKLIMFKPIFHETKTGFCNRLVYSADS